MGGQINGSKTASLTSTFAAGITGLHFFINSSISSSPGSSGPQALIFNLYILVSGSNIYQSNYDMVINNSYGKFAVVTQLMRAYH